MSPHCPANDDLLYSLGSDLLWSSPGVDQQPTETFRDLGPGKLKLPIKVRPFQDAAEY